MNLVKKIASNYKLPYYTLSPTYSVCKTHGYISGEHDTCPKCGEPAEIYSRITGYYRPVKNWNDGKRSEFSNRVCYDLNKSKLKDDTSDNQGSYMLFTTKTCPNCARAKELLKESNIEYELIDAEENADLTTKLGIMQAPTLVTPEGKLVSNVSNIIKYLNENK